MKNTVKKVSSLLTVTAIMAAMICNGVVSSSAVESREEKIPKITVSASAEEKATAEKIYAYLVAEDYGKAKTELENNPMLNLDEYPYVIAQFKRRILYMGEHAFEDNATVDDIKKVQVDIEEQKALYDVVIGRTTQDLTDFGSVITLNQGIFQNYCPLQEYYAFMASSEMKSASELIDNFAKSYKNSSELETNITSLEEALETLTHSKIYNEDNRFIKELVDIMYDDYLATMKKFYDDQYIKGDVVAAAIDASKYSDFNNTSMFAHGTKVSLAMAAANTSLELKKEQYEEMKKKKLIPVEDILPPSEEPTQKPTQAPTQTPTQKATQIPTEKSTQKLTPTQTPTQPTTVNNNSGNTNTNTNTNGNTNNNSANTVSGKVVNTDDNSGIVALGTLLVSASGIVFVSRKRKHS